MHQITIRPVSSAGTEMVVNFRAANPEEVRGLLLDTKHCTKHPPQHEELVARHVRVVCVVRVVRVVERFIIQIE